VNPKTTDEAVIMVNYSFRDNMTIKVKGTPKQVIKAITEFHKLVNNQKQVE
jgi:hypothetical protein